MGGPSRVVFRMVVSKLNMLCGMLVRKSVDCDGVNREWMNLTIIRCVFIIFSLSTQPLIKVDGLNSFS